ncbi:MAG: TetR family transcriptional regulator [Pseudonocardia sp. SCN 72-86]|nr:MAG: TetR family transcriptional regulator [Pseudonocardia sp. SCN 72-86]
MTFQRARSAEQREERRRAILDAASAMLTEMPVAAVTLNELARRVGLAKSNVLRYFDSREAVLLELLHAAFTEWLDALRKAEPEGDRGEWLAAALATSLRDRPVLCDLLASQAAVLEHNVSAEVAADFKRTALGDVAALAGIARTAVPELGDDALALAAAVVMSAGAIWSHTCPSEAMQAAYASDPALAALALPLADTLQTLFATLVAGLIARRAKGLAATLPAPWDGRER